MPNMEAFKEKLMNDLSATIDSAIESLGAGTDTAPAESPIEEPTKPMEEPAEPLPEEEAPAPRPEMAKSLANYMGKPAVRR